MWIYPLEFVRIWGRGIKHSCWCCGKERDATAKMRYDPASLPVIPISEMPVSIRCQVFDRWSVSRKPGRKVMISPQVLPERNVAEKLPKALVCSKPTLVTVGWGRHRKLDIPRDPKDSVLGYRRLNRKTGSFSYHMHSYATMLSWVLLRCLL